MNELDKSSPVPVVVSKIFLLNVVAKLLALYFVTFLFKK